MVCCDQESPKKRLLSLLYVAGWLAGDGTVDLGSVLLEALNRVWRVLV